MAGMMQKSLFVWLKTAIILLLKFYRASGGDLYNVHVYDNLHVYLAIDSDLQQITIATYTNITKIRCVVLCLKQVHCKAAVYSRGSRTCYVTSGQVTVTSSPFRLNASADPSIEKTYEYFPTLGVKKENPASNCKTLGYRPSGVYWISPDSSPESTFQVYCDLDTDGGGWTLAYHYGFTKYDSFNTAQNAVSLRPNWTASWAQVPISESAPRGNEDYGAIKYSLWDDIFTGEFMIKSNLNQWIVCSDTNGGFINRVNTPITCKMVKIMSTVCTNVVPSQLSWNNRGPSLKANSKFYYYWDGDLTANWPTHDPCGLNQPNQNKGVAFPYGSIYLR